MPLPHRGADDRKGLPGARAAARTWAMRLLRLDIENIGPFDSASLEFLKSPEDRPAVTFITGENGTGKTILIDAIRAWFGRPFAALERNIFRQGSPASIALTYELQWRLEQRRQSHAAGVTAMGYLNSIAPMVEMQSRATGGVVVDYWRSTPGGGGYEIESLSPPQLANLFHFHNALQGFQSNSEVTQLLCHFDYLRDSRDKKERGAGEALYAAAERIVKLGLLDGELTAVRRSTLTPMVRQAGHEVPLANISSGNAYFIQRMIGLLGRMYAVQVLCDKPIAELCHTRGLLLIDEAENHLHPRWQKRFLGDILSVFPHLQIIATTHSPFVLASLPGARVYVCRWDGQRCTVSEETEVYANQPVDEILLSPAFDGTQPFGPEISDLLRRRKQAIDAGDQAARRQIEEDLLARNPEHFSYLRVDQKLAALKGRAG